MTQEEDSVVEGNGKNFLTSAAGVITLLGVGVSLVAPLYHKGGELIQQMGLMLISGALGGANLHNDPNKASGRLSQSSLFLSQPSSLRSGLPSTNQSDYSPPTPTIYAQEVMEDYKGEFSEDDQTETYIRRDPTSTSQSPVGYIQGGYVQTDIEYRGEY